MKSLTRSLPVLLAAALTLAAGVIHGRWTDRWALNPRLQSSIERIPRIPAAFGRWQGEPIELNQYQRDVLDDAGIVAISMRRYVHEQTGEMVSILLVSGRPGPISAHTPQACYGGSGFALAAEPRRHVVPVAHGPGAPEAAFWRGLFRKENSPVPRGLMIYWTWSGDDRWVAAEPVSDPRIALARYDSLYKFYVVHEVDPSVPDGPDRKVGVQFIEEFLPVLNGTLFDPVPAGAAGGPAA